MSAAMHIGGLDLSSKRIGYAAPDGSLHSITPYANASDPARRLDELEAGLVRVIRMHPPAPTYVVIENYSLGGPGNRSSTMLVLGEVGGVIKLALYRLGIEYVAPTPTNLKRFATGKGNATKEDMVQAARDQHASVRNDDEADAFHLRHMGRIVHGQVLHDHDYQLDAIASSGVTW